MKTNVPFAIPRLSVAQMRAINTLVCYRLADLAQAEHYRSLEQLQIAGQMLATVLQAMQQRNVGRTVHVFYLRDGRTGLGSVDTEGASGLAAEPRDGPNGFTDCVIYAGVPVSMRDFAILQAVASSGNELIKDSGADMENLIEHIEAKGADARENLGS
jgi:hypothetical protein